MPMTHECIAIPDAHILKGVVSNSQRGARLARRLYNRNKVLQFFAVQPSSCTWSVIS
jgi:hypothetical protein